jgi:hypothetical protein
VWKKNLVGKGLPTATGSCSIAGNYFAGDDHDHCFASRVEGRKVERKRERIGAAAADGGLLGGRRSKTEQLLWLLP